MREIISTDEFDAAVEALGGYRAIDMALEPIMDGLMRNPYGFHRHESDWASFRYAVTERIHDVPPLVVTFTINEKRDVILQHIEIYDPYLE